MSSPALLWGLVIALLLATTLLTVMVIGLLRSYADIVKTLHDAGIRLDRNSPAGRVTATAPTRPDTPGRVAHPIAGETLEGGTRAVSTSGGEGILLLAFLSSGCAACVEYWRVLRSESGRLPGLDAPVLAVTKGPAREEPGKLAELTGGKVDVVMSDETWDAYDIPLTPHFALIDRGSGAILGEGSSGDPAALADLMDRAAADARNLTRRELLTRGKGKS